MSTESTTAAEATGPAPHDRKTLTDRLADNGALVGLLVVCVAMFIATPDFLTTRNMLNIGVQAAVVAVLAFGMTFVIVSGGIDLSVGSVAALAAIVTAWSAAEGVPGLLSVVLGLLAGLAAGAVNGLAVAVVGLPAFIATLAMLSIARGLALVISDGSPIPMPAIASRLGDDLGPVPVPVIVLVLAGLFAAFVLNRTVVGRNMYAVGGNEEAARLSGIRVGRVTVLVYAMSGVFAGLAGLVLAGRLASAQPQAAFGYELDAIAAVVIGGASLAGGTGRAFGTLIGALVLAVIRNGLNLLNVTAFWQQVVIGLVIAVAVAIDVLRRKRLTR